MILCPVLMLREIRAEVLDEEPPKPKGGGLLPMVAVWATAGFAAQTMREYAFARAWPEFEQIGPLPDLVHDNVQPSAAPVALFLFGAVAMLAIVIGRAYLRNNDCGIRLLRRVLYLHGLLMVLHATVRLGTTLPYLEADDRTLVLSFFAPPGFIVGQIELVLIATFLAMWSDDLSPLTKTVSLVYAFIALLLVSPHPRTPEALCVECIGRHGVTVHDEKYDTAWEADAGSTFDWFPDQSIEIASREGEAYFLALAQPK
ncbi:Hypothetical Protein FCC1311_031162 [Hondaea fermentalgiana]|uniref:Uncharacterized protein n=1 Tax=Hondaea fermentalgiana TaxID=2315210 RepID=A0A2R5GGC2_9STRA|nr:Hypothetical Protein FCC1311_031162 [Hondaea fermentalgiana]|eukprot:GBG26894.1 Hypothetical Protein FCC1311_031162 [Hondaea fermentalgiana]